MLENADKIPAARAKEAAQDNAYVKGLTEKQYEYGFTTDIHTEIIERGLNEEVIRLISSKKEEPEWLLAVSAHHYFALLSGFSPTAVVGEQVDVVDRTFLSH